MTLLSNSPKKLTRAGLVIASLAAAVAAPFGCGEAPGAFDDVSTPAVESELSEDTSAFDEEASPVVDKAIFIDDSLSCSSIPDRICPGVTLRLASQFLSVGNGIGVPFNPPLPVQEVFHGGGGMRAGMDYESIRCRSSGGEQRVFSEELELRLATETRLSARSDGAVNVNPPSRASNYPQLGVLERITCPNPTLGVLAEGFEASDVRGRGRYVSSRRITDAQTLVDGTARFLVRCDIFIDPDDVVIERERPRDLLSVDGRRFVEGQSLSSSQRQQRCGAMCGDHCAITFGADVPGAQDCTSVCTPDCVSRATTSLTLCPATNECSAPCAHPSDCGNRGGFNCVSGCCRTILH